LVELLLKIARCPRMQWCLDHPELKDPCAEVVHSQSVLPANHQVPEAWNGSLETAPILFISSNPGYDPNELYPTLSWSASRIIDFFVNRFHTDERYVQNGLRHRLSDLSFVHARRANRYWPFVRQRAAELLNLPKNAPPVPGKDYVLTEVVHCKSNSEKGVRSAMQSCAGEYLEAVVALSGAKVIVCLGDPAAAEAHAIFGVPSRSTCYRADQIGGRVRYFTHRPHSNSRSHRTFYAPDFPLSDLAMLRAVLRS